MTDYLNWDRDMDGGYFSSYRDGPDPKWVDPSRTNEKHSHPYSYSEFFLFGSAKTIKKAGADYSDRLDQWDWQKNQRLLKEHIPCPWNQATVEQVSAYISAYHGKPLKCVALAEGCNASNGYPYWIIWYRKA